MTTDARPSKAAATAAVGRRSFMGLMIDGVFSQLSLALRALLASVVLSILLEWLGMRFFWPELGVEHAYATLNAERDYLHADFGASLFEYSAVDLIKQFSAKAYEELFVASGIEQGVAWAAQKIGFATYIQVVPLVAQIFLLRLMILLFSMPVFLLFAVVGASTGLTLRDIRRWSGGREFGRVYHRARSTMPWAFAMSWVLYLTWPVSIHPNAIVLPCAVLLGLNVAITAATYKKYL